jgi:4-hydroxy-tetrahydrodipicolinate synthase
LAGAVPAIRYVKEEGVPSGPTVSRLVSAVGPDLDAVIGGGGARYLLEELDRGAVATMPAIELLSLHVALMTAYQAGRREEAVRLYEQSLPLLLIQAPYRMRLTKLILKHHSLIDTDLVREPLPEMDDTLKKLAIELYTRATRIQEKTNA